METINARQTKTPTFRYLAVQAKRQRLRTALMLVWVIIMPITLYYFSPYLPFMGLAEGLVCGSVFVFAGMFASSLFLGRLFCGWLCPAGAVQDFAFMARPQTVKRKTLQWVKFGLWAPWLGAWIGLAASAAGIRHDGLKLDFFFQLENGISVSRPAAYIVYLSVLSLILGLSLTIGRRAFCHASCWMAPFMVLGQTLGKALRLPGLSIRSAAESCNSCGSCSTACPMSLDISALAQAKKAKTGMADPVRIAHHDCVFCLRCVDACPSQVLRVGFGGR